MSDTNNEKRRDYQEFQYPHIEPEDIVLDHLPEITVDDWKQLTKLERAYVRWTLEGLDPKESMERVIDPRITFDLTLQNHQEISSRPSVKQFLAKARKMTSHLRYYSTERIAGLVHEEIQHLRISSRNKRYRTDIDTNMASFGGKKSLHEEETMDVDLLIRFLDMVMKLKEAAGIKDGAPDTVGGSQGGGIARLTKAAEELINAAKSRSGPDTE